MGLVQRWDRINHDSIITGMWVISVVLSVLAFTMQMLRTGEVDLTTTLMVTVSVAVVLWRMGLMR